MPSVVSTFGGPAIERLQQRRGDGVADIRRGDDAQQVGRALGDAHRLLRRHRQVDHLRRQPDDPLTGRRQREHAAGALDERVAEALAQRAERLRHRRLADAQGARRGPQRSEADDEHEDLELVRAVTRERASVGRERGAT